MLPLRTYQMATAQVWGIDLGTWSTSFQVRAASGRLAGRVTLLKPAAGMSILGPVASLSDVRHFERTQHVVTAAEATGGHPVRRSGGVVSSGSATLHSRLLHRCPPPCPGGRTSASSMPVDWSVATWVTESWPSSLPKFWAPSRMRPRPPSKPAAALRNEAIDIAERSGLGPNDLVLRFGLRRGAPLYVGLIKTVARSEVTALGDEVNEAALIEACASGGRALASKSLVERLDREAPHVRSSLTTSPTRLLASWLPPPRRLDVMHRLSLCATCRSNHTDSVSAPAPRQEVAVS